MDRVSVLLLLFCTPLHKTLVFEIHGWLCMVFGMLVQGCPLLTVHFKTSVHDLGQGTVFCNSKTVVVKAVGFAVQ